MEHDGVLDVADDRAVSTTALSEIFNALWNAGLTITLFEEHQSVPWNPLGDGMVEDDDGRVPPARHARAARGQLHAASR